MEGAIYAKGTPIIGGNNVIMTIKTRRHAGLCAILLLSLCISAQSQQLPSNLTEQQQQKLDQYILDYIKVLRVKEPQPQPPMVEEFNKKYTEYCGRRAEAEYKKHGRWFYCEDSKEFRGDIRWDEVVTYRTYWQLYCPY